MKGSNVQEDYDLEVHADVFFLDHLEVPKILGMNQFHTG